MNQPKREVLVVEDNRDDLLLVRRALETRGVTMHHAADLAQALAFCARSLPDVVLLDLHLGDSQGIATFTTLHSVHPGLPIVVLTGLDDEVLGERAIAAGAQDWFRKDDIDPRLLPRVLNHACQRQALTMALKASESRALASEAMAKANEIKARNDRAAMERMLAIVSHDLRAPLHGIRACIASLLENPEVNDSVLPLCDAIGKEAGYLIELATNLIDVDRIANGRMPWQWERADPGQVAREVVLTLQPLAASVGTRLTIGAINALPIQGDAQACRRLVTHLVINAIRHAAASQIQLSCSGDAAGARFTVTDDGRGIDPSAGGRLGRPLAADEEGGARGGVGLGFAISLGIVAAHGGYLSIRSRQGKGTCVKAVLRGDLSLPRFPQGAEMFQELDLA